MKTNPLTQECIFAMRNNVACNFGGVKGAFTKIAKYSCAVFAAAVLALGLASTAHAEDDNTRAMLNSTSLLNYLGGVIPQGMPYLMENIQKGAVHRVAPSYPVWIMETEGGTILYYQGQPKYTGQSGSRLIDDNGFRFGQRALDQAATSRSTWLRITLSGKEFRAYCASKAPFVACSLIP